ncbi:Free fatty acid receptor 3 G-protein coupled receptor 41 [Triplophysa tibetana]|uniref:Free fatty acid receptor 3 G-protein coupled receptor 41 n=1 Tax=Triplophysa tibetana TaxID=1572043 RepID=A0A5A9NMN7_9TELE|nr:Free fatty acid receptor 3 G-protein coupled receptor 41 [Triplophysa tibetana]
MSGDVPTAVFLPIYIITFLIGFPNSVLAFYSCIRKIRSKPFPIDIFMFNLVVSDLIFLTFLPLKMKEAGDNMLWNMSKLLCLVHLFLFFLPIYSTCLFLAAISIERYVCVAFPANYRSPRRITYAIIICVAIWMFCVITSGFGYQVILTHTTPDKPEDMTNHTEPYRCYSNFSTRQLKDLLTMRLVVVVPFFCLPFIICLFCYISAIRILFKLPLIKRRRRLRAIGLALGTVIVFTICFAPYNASHIVGYIKQEDPNWRMKVLMLTTLNAGLDPFIFYCISWEMRNVIKICVQGFFQSINCLK